MQTPAVQSLARRLENGGALAFSGVTGPAQPFFAALLQELFPGRSILVVTENSKTQERFQQDLDTWLAATPLFYPAWDILPHEGKLPHADVISDRLQTLVALSNQSKVQSSRSKVVVANVAALLQKTFAPDDLKDRTRQLGRGDRHDPLDLVEWLEEQGYEPEAQVTQKGEIAMRGGIVDVFPPTSLWPVRLEFFGNDLESIREFDPMTQISRGEIVEIVVPPAGELGILRKREGAGAASRRSPSETFLNYLPPDSIVILCEPELLAVRAEEYSAQVPAEDPFFANWPDLLAEIRSRFTSVELTEETEAGEAPGVLRFDSLDAFRPLSERAPEPPVAEAQRREFFHQLHRWLRQDYAVHVFCNNDGERQRFEEVNRELMVAAGGDKAGSMAHDSPFALRIGSLSRGFICDAAKLVVITDAEIFGRYKVQRPRKLKSPHALAARSALDIDFTDLEEGDLVVHLQYGIGKFLGLKNLPVSSRDPGGQTPDAVTECLVIEYAAANPTDDPPKLYVPVSEAHLVSKYVGAGKANPPLNTLGGTRWAKAKEQAERAVRDVAAELLRIQAARETQAGYAFKPDVPWQREFESAFIYEETPDQITAIAATKADMEKAKPMDRLICGDVGFGKTEVAIRAAFKAVMDGRQVAVLVPTTVLAQQHFNNFRERMADYPVRIELLSRFRTRREQQRVVKDLAAGAVDIVIGTHRIVQEDIEFKDLGLVVIDE
ncbi:MAG TPA: DEAD/DEAH box helicase, partial [Desulfuromonadaceae bacterium]|nr:DEAD/DEAH box helicase [Desulfuromonadaceae bacterium]